MDNKAIAKIFDEMADMLQIKGENVFKVNSYRRAAMVIENLPFDLRKVAENNPHDLRKIPSIGEGLASKIIELLQSGKCAEYDALKKQFPKGLLEMMNLRTLGPKKVQLLYNELKIQNLAQLKKAAEKHLIRELPRMGPKSEEEILKSIEEYATFAIERHLISEALQEAESYVSYLKNCPVIDKVQYAGSLRRRAETIGDIDIIATIKKADQHETVMDFFINYPEVLKVVANGDTKSNVILQSGISVDLRVIENKSFGAALHYFTGNKDHNIHMRDIAKKKGLKLNEYGLLKGTKIVAGATEEEIFNKLGVPYIIPEIRENEGEIEYGLKNKKFPKFIELKDIKGDLHNHSKYSDGKNTIEEMAEAFISFGYEYFAMTDHSSVLGITTGMGSNDIKKQWKEIDKLNKIFKGKIVILKGVEVDILKDGSLDFEDEILRNLDVVVISAHMYNRIDEDVQTKRLISAIENPYARILAHPTGRLINKRAEMKFDMEKVINACVANNVALEINASPNRLDLAFKYIKIAKSKGAKFVINTDSHSIYNPEFMDYGVGMAKKGWLESKDVINTYTLPDLTQFLRGFKISQV